MRFLLPLFSLGCLLLTGTMNTVHAEETATEQAAWNNYHKLDQELTDLYQKILISLSNEKSRENFTKSENTWLEFRQAQGIFVAEDPKGGAPSKALMAANFTETTETRIAQLKKWQTTSPEAK